MQRAAANKAGKPLPSVLAMDADFSAGETAPLTTNEPAQKVDKIDEQIGSSAGKTKSRRGATQGADASTAPPQPLGLLSRVQLDEPQDHVAVAFGRAAHGRETVDNGRLKPDQPFALHVCLRFTAESGSVPAIASKAAGVIAMRINGVANGRGFEVKVRTV